MELEKIRELIEMMQENDLTELKIVDGETRILLRRGASEAAAPQVVAMPPVLGAGGAGVPWGTGAGAAAEAAAPAEEEGQDNLVEITSPMVGTFYSAPSPNADPFVKVGAGVDDDSVVCVIEAMKVMNEVKSEVKGVIREILVESGAAVEFGQPLFRVEPG